MIFNETRLISIEFKEHDVGEVISTCPDKEPS